MKYKWCVVVIVILLVSPFLLQISAEASALHGWMSLTSGTIFFLSVIESGWQVSRVNRGIITDEEALPSHKIAVSIFTAFIVLGVILTEVAVIKQKEMSEISGIFVLHISTVLLSLVAFFLASKMYTGKTNPNIHKRIVYIGFLAPFCVAYATGTMLFLEKYPPSTYQGSSSTNKNGG